MSNINIEKSKQIIDEMMNDRGYKYSEKDNNKLIYITEDKKKFTIIIFAEKKEDIKKKQIDKYISDNDVKNTNILLVITFIDNNEKIPNKYTDYETNNIQVFHIKDLLFNITKHKYVPKHSILNNNEKEKFSSLYNIENIAKIKVNDPVCRYYFAKINDIIKIIRPSNNSKEEINYRLCI